MGTVERIGKDILTPKTTTFFGIDYFLNDRLEIDQTSRNQFVVLFSRCFGRIGGDIPASYVSLIVPVSKSISKFGSSAPVHNNQPCKKPQLPPVFQVSALHFSKGRL